VGFKWESSEERSEEEADRKMNDRKICKPTPFATHSPASNVPVSDPTKLDELTTFSNGAQA